MPCGVLGKVRRYSPKGAPNLNLLFSLEEIYSLTPMVLTF